MTRMRIGAIVLERASGEGGLESTGSPKGTVTVPLRFITFAPIEAAQFSPQPHINLMKPHPLTQPILALMLVPAGLIAVDSASIKAPLHATNDADASGLVVATLSSKKSEMIVQVKNLAPSHTFA